MDARIGELNGGKFYAYVNGYAAAPVMGTLEEVEVALGLRAAAPAHVKVAQPTPGKTFTVTLRFQFPAWNEVDGIAYHGIEADSKAAANTQVRRLAHDDGHLCGHKGRVTITATESE